MATTPPSPKLTPSSTSATNAKTQTTENRLNDVLPNVASPNSPVTVYLPAAVNGVGDQVKNNTTTAPGGAGAWTCPNGVTSVQVEVAGGGGGGGGGSAGAVKPIIVASAFQSTAANITASFWGTVPSGNSVVVFVRGSAAPSSITDTQGNTYTRVDTAGTLDASVWLATNIVGLTAGQDFITAVNNGATTSELVVGYAPDVTGIDGAFTQVTATGTGTTISQAVTVPATDSCVAFIWTTPNESFTNTSSWSTLGSYTANSHTALAYWTQAAISESLPVSVTWGGSTSWSVLVLAFTCSTAPAVGGGGGGGGEYACETNYPVIPGESYSYTIGAGGSGGVSGQPGAQGGQTVFDSAGNGIAGGVVANGGGGGDVAGAGVGGTGGTGSSNSVHMTGGNGGSNTAGIGSDSPKGVVTNLLGWWVLDDTNGTYFRDISGNNNDGTAVQGSNGQLLMGVPSGGSAPPQAPTANGTNTRGTTKKNAVAQWHELVANTAAGWVNLMGHHTTSTFTFSAWIRGSSQGWGNTNSNAVIVSSHTTNNGFTLNLSGTNNNTLTAQFWSSNTVYTLTYTGINAVPNQWYHIAVTFNAGAVVIYVNGQPVSSTSNIGISSIPLSDTVLTLGVNPSNRGNPFNGWMSNVWVANSAVSASYFAAAYGSAPVAGGSGGGGGAGSSASGSTGTGATTSSGAAGGAAVPAASVGLNSGGGAGGNGGNSGASGSVGANNTSNPAVPASGGGGGSGAGSTPATIMSLQLGVQASATYCGPDATGGNAGNIYVSSAITPASDASGVDPNPALANTTSTVYQGGYASGNGPSLGTMNSLLLLPTGIAGQLANATIQQVTLTVNPVINNPSALILGYSNDTTLPSTWTGADITALAQLQGTGQPQTFDITNTGIGAALKSGSATALTLGPGSTPGNAAYNGANAAAYYGAFTGADTIANGGMYLTVQYTNGSVIGGGMGATGYIAVTYVNPNGTPVAGINPQLTTDASGNQWSSGYTGQIKAFDPTITTPGQYKPEAWKDGTSLLLNTNATWTVVGAFKYQFMSDSSVWWVGRLNTTSNIASGTSVAVFSIPTGYSPSTTNHTISGWGMISTAGSSITPTLPVQMLHNSGSPATISFTAPQALSTGCTLFFNFRTPVTFS